MANGYRHTQGQGQVKGEERRAKSEERRARAKSEEQDEERRAK